MGLNVCFEVYGVRLPGDYYRLRRDNKPGNWTISCFLLSLALTSLSWRISWTLLISRIVCSNNPVSCGERRRKATTHHPGSRCPAAPALPPAALPLRHWSVCEAGELEEEASDFATLLRPAAPGVVRLWAVSRAVNNVRNNCAGLLVVMADPVPETPAEAALDTNFA